jgi:D-serine deaminase-like pyridoxal phosphate-dependent protein
MPLRPGTCRGGYRDAPVAVRGTLPYDPLTPSRSDPRMTLQAVPTPAAILDVARMEHNIARMQSRMDTLGVAFRPHVKTAKCLEVARRQRAAGARAITVSTLKEAQEFFAGGFADILYAVAIVPSKLPAVEALLRAGCDLKIIVDSVEGARAIVEHARGTGTRFCVLVEIDSDQHRSGVGPDEPRLLDIGRTLHEGGCDLAGVMTHAGSSYDFHTPDALLAISRQERDLCVRAADRLRAAGLPCPIVSVGSTPTALSVDDLAGVTEVRAGVYVFFDLFMSGVGVCRPQDVALSVLTTVIGHQAAKGWVIVDAGWMAMSRDRGTQKQALDQGYGLVCDASGRMLGDYIVAGANQEHGIVAARDGSIDPDLPARFPIGTQLRILPNHACATGAQFGEYHALAADGSLAVWPRFGGW